MCQYGMVIKTYVQSHKHAISNFERIHLFSMIVSVSSISAFWCSENATSGQRSLGLTKQYRLQFRCLGVTYRDVMCEQC